MTGRIIPFRRPSDLRQLPDESLISAAATGDNGALEELFQRHGDTVHRIMSRLRTVDRKDLDDVVQTTFLEVRRSARSFDGRATVRIWVIGIAMNVARRHARSQVRRRAAVSAIADMPVTTVAASLYDEAAHRQLLSRLATAFDELPHDLRVVFTLCDLESMRGVEVARILEVPEGTVWRRLHEARAGLRVQDRQGRATVRMRGVAWLTLRRRGCPAAWKLTRAVSVAADAPERDLAIDTHLAGCASCAADCAALRKLVIDAQSLSAPARMSSASRAAFSAQLRAAPPEPQRRGRALRPRTIAVTAVAAVTAAAAATIAVLAVSERPETPEPRPNATGMAGGPSSRASIRAIGAARFFRAQSPPDEIVRLEDGRIELDVNPLAAGERFRLVTEHGEVEVRGTSFEVLATHGSLRSVSVSRGRVEVRSGSGLAVLVAGDRWQQADPPEPVPAPSVVVETPPPRRAVGSKTPASRQASAVESALFDHAWSSLRAGNAAAAAIGFAELEHRAKGRAIEEDALYWRAVSVACAKDSVSAGLLFREFLRRFPLSSRRGEASVALGWISFDAGNVNDARKAFEQVLSDPASSFRDSATAGIRRTTSR